MPKSVGKYTDQAKGQADNNAARVIYTIGPSYVDINRIWIGTDDGVIATTADGGKNWSDVTPPQISSYWKVFIIDAGRFDPLTAYAAVNTLRIDDMNPHIFRTHDGGKTWKEIVSGIPGGAPVSVVREDAKKKGLLFAGSETQVYFSVDDGDHWQSLRNNMAASSVRDLVIKDDDLVVGTHGRGIWILDDITPLRQITAATINSDMLFTPEPALRVRWDTNPGTPVPPDEPHLPNPPEGSIIDYYLKSPASGPVTLEIFGDDNKLVRRYSSSDPVAPLPDPKTNAPLPLYWYRQPQSLSAAAGMHRFTWDVHYQPLPGGGGGRGGGGALPMQAVPFDTAPAPTTPWVNTGSFTVKLTVNGKTYTQPIVVKQDPLFFFNDSAMKEIYTLSKAAYYGAIDAQTASQQVQHVRDQIAALLPQAKGADADALTALDKKIETDLGEPGGAAAAGGRGGRGGGGRGGGGAGAPANALSTASTGLSGVMNSLQAADVAPTTNELTAINAAQAAATKAMAAWNAIKTTDVPAVNLKLKAAGLAVIGIQ